MDIGEYQSVNPCETAGEAGLSLRHARRQIPGLVRSNRRLAEAAGISERHLYRLLAQGNARSAGAQRLYEQMVGNVLVGDILSRLGHHELVGTSAHDFLDMFVRVMAKALAELYADDPSAIDMDFAERIARQSIERLRGCHSRENEIDLKVRAPRASRG